MSWNHPICVCVCVEKNVRIQNAAKEEWMTEAEDRKTDNIEYKFFSFDGGEQVAQKVPTHLSASLAWHCSSYPSGDISFDRPFDSPHGMLLAKCIITLNNIPMCVLASKRIVTYSVEEEGQIFTVESKAPDNRGM